MGLRLRGARGRSLAMDSRNGLLKVVSNDSQTASCGYNDARKNLIMHVLGVELTKRGVLDGRCYAH